MAGNRAIRVTTPGYLKRVGNAIKRTCWEMASWIRTNPIKTLGLLVGFGVVGALTASALLVPAFVKRLLYWAPWVWHSQRVTLLETRCVSSRAND